MDLDVTHLRSALQHACPIELRNLTVNDLSEGKWSTKKIVFLALFSCCPSLEDEFYQMEDLIEKRDIGIQDSKASNAPKEKRLEAEQQFRTNFMRVVLVGLTRLRWPPTLEAFSDPIDVLFNDNSAVLESFTFVLKVGIPGGSMQYFHETRSLKCSEDNLRDRKSTSSAPQGMHQRLRGGKQQTRDPEQSVAFDSLLGTPISRVETPVSRQSDFLHQSLPYTPPSPLTTFDNVHPLQTPSFSGNTSGNAEDFDGGSCGTGRKQQQPLGRKHQQSGTPEFAEREQSRIQARSRHPKEQQQQPLHQGSVPWRAFMIIQHQNEVLRSQLCQLKTSVQRRADAECKMEGVLCDLQEALGEIASIGAATSTSGSASTSSFDTPSYSCSANNNSSVLHRSSSNSARNSEPPFLRNNTVTQDSSPTGVSTAGGGRREAEPAPASVLSAEDHAQFQEEVAREQVAADMRKNSTKGISLANYEDSTSRAAAAGSAATATASRSSVRGTCPRCGEVVTGTKGPQSRQAQTPPSSVIWKRLHAKVCALTEQWQAAQRGTTRMAALPRADINPAAGVVAASGSLCTPSERAVHGCLGVHRRSLAHPSDQLQEQCGTARGAGRGSVGAEEGLECLLGLDLQRLHQAQRDLVAFAEAAFELSRSIPPVGSGGGILNEGISGMNQSEGSDLNLLSSYTEPGRAAALLALQERAWDLLLRLSCVAPIAPLQLQRSPLTSSLTGLQAVIEEANSTSSRSANGQETSGSKQQQQQRRLQTAADRALAEQAATIRCLQRSHACLQQWVHHASQSGPVLRSLGQRYQQLIGQALKQLEAPMSICGELSTLLREAEQARVPSTVPYSASSSTSIQGSQYHPRGGLDDSSLASEAGGGSTSGRSFRGGPMVAPLDSLARGAAGPEVAALVLALRMHASHLGDLAAGVRALKDRLGAELFQELRLLRGTEQACSGAADRSVAEMQAQVEALNNLQGQGQRQHLDFSATDPLEGGFPECERGSSARSVTYVGKHEGSTYKGRPRSQQGSSARSSKPTLDSRPPFDLSLS